MIKIQCQHCKDYLDFFVPKCTHCNKTLQGATAINLLGQCTIENLTGLIKAEDLRQAKKKATLYIKLCEKFLCDVELATLNLCTSRAGRSSMAMEAIEDVRQSHVEHLSNLEKILTVINHDYPELEAPRKTLTSINEKMQASLNIWLNSVCRDD